MSYVEMRDHYNVGLYDILLEDLSKEMEQIEWSAKTINHHHIDIATKALSAPPRTQ